MASRHAEQPDKLFAAANLTLGLLLAANKDFLLAIALLTHKLIERHFWNFPSLLLAFTIRAAAKFLGR